MVVTPLKPLNKKQGNQSTIVHSCSDQVDDSNSDRWGFLDAALRNSDATADWDSAPLVQLKLIINAQLNDGWLFMFNESKWYLRMAAGLWWLIVDDVYGQSIMVNQVWLIINN